jgi:hypothetical protein
VRRTAGSFEALSSCLVYRFRTDDSSLPLRMGRGSVVEP